MKTLLVAVTATAVAMMAGPTLAAEASRLTSHKGLSRT